jgi:hypothetical protein
VSEAERARRTAYRSGRLELVGYQKDPMFTRKTRKVLDKTNKNSQIFGTPFKGKFRWKQG